MKQKMKFLMMVLFVLALSPLPSLTASERKASDFSYITAEGSSTFFSLLKTNKVVLVYFGDDSAKSWEKLSDVNAVLSEYRYRGSNLEVLAIVPGKEPAKLEALADEHWLNFSLLPDLDGKIAKSFHVQKYPEMIIIDPFGIIQFQAEPLTQDALREKLNAYVDKPVAKAFCPVDKMWVVVTDKTPSVVYKGARYYFCNSEDHDGRRMDQEFLEDPDRYAKEARLHMEKEKTSARPAKSEGTVLFECPMKDSPAQNKPGTCSKCGMLLQKI